MSWSEIVSLVSIFMSGLTAVGTALLPAFFNYRLKKQERLDKLVLEEEKRKLSEIQKFNSDFEQYYQAHLQIISNLTEHYGKWKSGINNQKLISYIYQIAPQFPHYEANQLYNFATKVTALKQGDDIDTVFNKLISDIFHCFGLRESANTPSFLKSEMLRTVLLEEFKKKDYAHIANLNLHSK